MNQVAEKRKRKNSIDPKIVTVCVAVTAVVIIAAAVFIVSALNKKNKVKKVELFTDHYKVEGNFYVGLEKNNLDYENHKEANNQYNAYSENKTVKMTYNFVMICK